MTDLVKWTPLTDPFPAHINKCLFLKGNCNGGNVFLSRKPQTSSRTTMNSASSLVTSQRVHAISYWETVSTSLLSGHTVEVS